MAKTILLTGATGYLGGYLSKSFLDNGYNLIALCLNEKEHFKHENENVKVYYLDKTSLADIFKENKINMIVHTAVRYGRNKENISEMLEANVLFPLKILTLAEDSGIELFINTDSILTPKLNFYAMTKHNVVDWLSMFADKFKVANMRLDHFYGPNDNPVKFIAWVIGEMKNNVSKIDLTDGSQTRDFIYIDDVVNAYNYIIQNLDKLSLGLINTFEVGTNIKTSIKTMVSLIYEGIKPKDTVLNFGAIPYRKNEMLDYEVNTTALRLLGWKPEYTVEKGINKIIQIEIGERK